MKKLMPLLMFVVLIQLGCASVKRLHDKLTLTYHPELMREQEHFGILEMGFPKACMPVPDSLRQEMASRAEQFNLLGFQYDIKHMCSFEDGHALVLKHIVNQWPRTNFAYLDGYTPWESDPGQIKDPQIKQLKAFGSERTTKGTRQAYSSSKQMHVRVYTFMRSGFMVQQAFAQSVVPIEFSVYQLDLITENVELTDMMGKTFESVVASMRRSTAR